MTGSTRAVAAPAGELLAFGDDVLGAVLAEASRTVGGAATILLRRDGDAGAGTVVAASDDSVRVGDPAPGDVAGVPVVVEGRPWGLLAIAVPDGSAPPELASDLARYADMASAALAGAQARHELRRLIDEQSALRRVAELVAHGGGEEELFRTVTVEAAGLVAGEPTTLVRYEGDRTFTILATQGGPVAPGTSVVVPPGDHGALARMIEDPYRAVRLEDYGVRPGSHFTHERYGVASSVSVPIRVDDGLWGSLGVLTRDRSLPPETEERLQKFADLVAAALANGQARRQLARLADEQAALRRVAELVASDAPLEEVFAATATEASRMLGHLAAAVIRFDDGDAATVAATCHSAVPLGLRLPVDGDSVAARVHRAGRAVRLSSYAGTDAAALAARHGVGAAVGVPVIVDGRIDAVLAASTDREELPAGAERRLAELAALAAAAIANAENRAALAASRARVIATADETRRRLQRDVHDGAQQRLVQTVIALEIAQDALARGGSPASMVDEALHHAQRATTELRELVQGLLPGALSRGGLRAALEALVTDLPMDVHLDFGAPALPRALETTAYFVVAEALANVVKHAQAQRVDVRVEVQGDHVVLEVCDDGLGGADPARGTGLTGLSDRVAAAEGALEVRSPPGGGTALRARLPVGAAPT